MRRDRSLVAVLEQLDLDELIPEALYAALAELLVWVYDQDRKLGQQRRAAAAAAGY